MQKYLKVLHKDDTETFIKEADVILRNESGILYNGDSDVVSFIPRASIKKLFRVEK